MHNLIKQIYEDIPSRLTKSYYGKKIMAAYNAYGSGYDFCRFYACENPEVGFGTVYIYNSSMVIDGSVNADDISMLIKMTKPANIEISGGTLLQPEGYAMRHRTLFKAVPNKTDVDFSNVNVNTNAEDCYKILAESFENMGSFEDWYVDISHRIRHGVSELYYYGDTTVTKNFDIDGFVFVSHIATAETARGKGGARRLLYCLAERFAKEEKEVHLFALDHRKTFYEAIGFEPVAEDILFERKELLIGD